MRIRYFNRLTLNSDGARVRLSDASKKLDDGAFSGAILSDKTENFATVNVKTNPAGGEYPRVLLG
jgi:hypothetical protein